MRVVLFLFLFLPILAFSQINHTDSNGLRQGLWQKEQANGRLIYEGTFKDGKPEGEWKRYHSGGQLKAVINYKTDSDSAHAQLFDEWKKKVAEGNYLNEKKSGLWIYFVENKKVADEQFEDGLKQGVSHRYYKSGELWEEIDWVKGKQEGKYQVFSKNGDTFLQCKMSNDKRHGLCITYFENGKMEMEAYYFEGLRDKEWKYYNNEGQFSYSLIYNKGELLNPEVRDSISNVQIENMEMGKDKIIDPEKYMQDPSEYMRKMNIYR